MRTCARLALLCCAALPGLAMAQTGDPATPQPPPVVAEDQAQASTSPEGMTTGLTGNWGGLRSRLFDRGFDFQLAYIGEPAWNARGGTKQDVTYVGQAIAGISVDLNKLAGVKGGKVQVTLFHRHGPSLDAQANTGMFQLVQEAFGRGQIARLAEAWYQQSFADGRASIKAGRVAANTDFANFACDFQNLSFCAPPQGNLPVSAGYWFDAPASNWGAVGRLNFGKDRKQGYAMIGAFQINPKNIDPHNGFNLSFSGATGALIPFEAAWTPMLGGDKPGYYKIGAWYETSRGVDVARDINGQLIAVSGLAGRPIQGHYGAYLQFAQQLTPSPKGIDRTGLSVFLNVTQFDPKTSIVDSQIATGITQTGTFLGRPNDQIAFAVARTHVNGRLRLPDEIAVSQGLMSGVRHSEYVLELDYRVVPLPGLKIAPNVQWGIDPGGVAERRNVLAFGVKTSLGF